MLSPTDIAVVPRTLVVPTAVVAALSGGVVAVQGKLNGDLATVGAGVVIAGWLSYIGTLATIALVIVACGRFGVTVQTLRRDGSWWWYAIGLCGVPIVLATAAGIPVVGVAIASVCAVAGQTVSGLALDARGVGLPDPLRLTRRRLLAGLAALVGLAVAVLAGSDGAATDPLLVVAICGGLFLAGAVVCGQFAGNGRVAVLAGDPVVPGLTSVAGGTVGISLVLVAVAIGGGLDDVALPALGEYWYLYLGGPLGAVITVAASWCVRHLGTFALTLAMVGGQMIAALILDLTGAVGVRWPTIVATAVVCGAVILAVETAPRGRTTESRRAE